MVLRGGKQSFIMEIGQYSQSLFHNMWSEHMLKVEKTPILAGTLAGNGLIVILIIIGFKLVAIYAINCDASNSIF